MTIRDNNEYQISFITSKTISNCSFKFVSLIESRIGHYIAMGPPVVNYSRVGSPPGIIFQNIFVFRNIKNMLVLVWVDGTVE